MIGYLTVTLKCRNMVQTDLFRYQLPYCVMKTRGYKDVRGYDTARSISGLHLIIQTIRNMMPM